MKKETILQAINEFPKEVNLNALFEQLIVKEKTSNRKQPNSDSRRCDSSFQ
jgi:hypothetical protein